MIALIQRVNHAILRIDGSVYSQIDQGLVVFLGLEKQDTLDQGCRLLEKVASYRVFADDQSRMNCSVRDVNGSIMLVSQFTLAAATDKGLRPSFSSAMPPAEAEDLYDKLMANFKAVFPALVTGKFVADMKVVLENDGPVTFLLNT